MRIKHKDNFIMGLITIIVGIVSLIACVYQHRGDETIFAFVTITWGIVTSAQGLENKSKKRKKKLENSINKGGILL